MIASLCRDSTLGVSLSGNSRGSSTKRRSDIEIFFVKRSPRFQHETEEVYSWLHYVGVHNKFCVQKVDLHLFKPIGKVVGVHNKFLCARGRPTSVQTSWKGCGGPQQVSVCKKSTNICSNILERLWGSTTSFCVKEVDLHLFKPLGQVYKFSLLKYNGAILPTGVGLLDNL